MSDVEICTFQSYTPAKIGLAYWFRQNEAPCPKEKGKTELILH
jgi:hypothetical protein